MKSTAPDAPTALQALQAVSWLNAARAATLERLAQAAHVEMHSTGAMVARRGQRCSHLMVVVSGFLLVGFDLADGRRHVVNMIGPGQVQALIPLLDEGPMIHDARTKGWVQVLLIPRDAFVMAMQDDLGLNWQVLRLLSARSRRLYDLLGERTALPLGVRLARILRGLFVQYGESLQISQEELAEILGVTRQSVNRELRELQAQGVATIGRGRVVLLNRPLLMSLCGHEPAHIPVGADAPLVKERGHPVRGVDHHWS